MPILYFRAIAAENSAEDLCHQESCFRLYPSGVYESMAEVKVYGADWCEHTQRVLSHLDDLEVPYKYIDIEDDERSAAWVRHQNDGKECKPTVDVGGIILLTPTEAELDDLLRDAKLIPEGMKR